MIYDTKLSDRSNHGRRKRKNKDQILHPWTTMCLRLIVLSTRRWQKEQLLDLLLQESWFWWWHQAHRWIRNWKSCILFL